jgi:periplasmic protein TonB
MSPRLFAVVEPMRMPMRAVRPLACSLAIHLGLGVIVVFAGAAGLAPSPPPRAVWLDLAEEIPAPPSPATPAAVSRPRPVRAPAVEPRRIPAPVASAAPDEPVAPAAQPLLPPPPLEAAPPPPAPMQSPPSQPQGATVAEAAKALEPDSGGAPSSPAASAGASMESRPRSAVASRTPDTAPGGPVVRAARPRGGYQVRPVYPESARRAGVQGTTLLRIHIETDGRVSDVSVARSAGHQALDEAAADAVRRWRFEPALNAAGPVSMWAVVPVEFRIGDRD